MKGDLGLTSFTETAGRTLEGLEEEFRAKYA
jgi:hypothetical protein